VISKRFLKKAMLNIDFISLRPNQR